MRSFSSKIEAIKALREESQGILTQLETMSEGGSPRTVWEVSKIGLKEAKDFIEGAMVLGANEVTVRSNSLAEENAHLRNSNYDLSTELGKLHQQIGGLKVLTRDWARVQELVEQLRVHTKAG